MEIKPIRTEQEYNAALEEVEMLMEAKAGTPELDRLEVLTSLIETYERRVYPIAPPDPISAIEYEMEKRGLSPTDLLEILQQRQQQRSPATGVIVASK